MVCFEIATYKPNCKSLFTNSFFVLGQECFVERPLKYACCHFHMVSEEVAIKGVCLLKPLCILVIVCLLKREVKIVVVERGEAWRVASA